VAKSRLRGDLLVRLTVILIVFLASCARVPDKEVFIPDLNRKLVFIQEADSSKRGLYGGNFGDLIALNLENRSHLPLTSDIYYDEGVTCSSYGENVVYISHRGNHGGEQELNEPAQLRMLTEFESRNVRIDSRFVNTENDYNYSFEGYNLSTFKFYKPVLSLSGNKVAVYFASINNTAKTDDLSRIQLRTYVSVIMDLKNNEMILVDGESALGEMSWSDDESELMIVSKDGIWIYVLEEESLTKISNWGMREVAIHKGHNRMLYHQKNRKNREDELYEYDLRSDSLKMITKIKWPLVFKTYEYVGEDSIAYIADNIDRGYGEVWLYSLSENRATQVTDNGLPKGSLAWCE